VVEPDTEEKAPAEEAVPPRRRAYRPRPVWLLAVVGLVVVYVVVLLLYAPSGRNVGYEPSEELPADGVRVVMELGALDAVTGRLHAEVTVAPGPALSTDEVRPDEDLDIVIVPAAGAQQLRFPRGEVPATVPVELFVDGEVQKWPFDTYDGQLVVQALHGSGDDRTPVPLQVHIEGQVKGWKVTTTSASGEQAALSDGLQWFALEAKRAGGTLAFGLIMIAVLVALPVLSLFVCYQVLRGRRKVEATYASWIAAMLFATVPLRNFLPGAPPAGSWIDITVVLWVIVGLVFSLVLYVAAWWRHSPATAPPPR